MSDSNFPGVDPLPATSRRAHRRHLRYSRAKGSEEMKPKLGADLRHQQPAIGAAAREHREDEPDAAVEALNKIWVKVTLE